MVKNSYKWSIHNPQDIIKIGYHPLFLLVNTGLISRDQNQKRPREIMHHPSRTFLVRKSHGSECEGWNVEGTMVHVKIGWCKMTTRGFPWEILLNRGKCSAVFPWEVIVNRKNPTLIPMYVINLNDLLWKSSKTWVCWTGCSCSSCGSLRSEQLIVSQRELLACKGAAQLELRLDSLLGFTTVTVHIWFIYGSYMVHIWLIYGQSTC